LAGNEAVQTAVVVPAAVLTEMGWADVQFKLTGELPPSVEVNVTVPVGLVAPAIAGLMVAVKVTAWLTAAEGTDETTVVVVEA
jgi:ABC-type glucose/galactose transport system permease subunit